MIEEGKARCLLFVDAEKRANLGPFELRKKKERTEKLLNRIPEEGKHEGDTFICMLRDILRSFCHEARLLARRLRCLRCLRCLQKEGAWETGLDYRVTIVAPPNAQISHGLLASLLSLVFFAISVMYS